MFGKNSPRSLVVQVQGSQKNVGKNDHDCIYSFAPIGLNLKRIRPWYLIAAAQEAGKTKQGALPKGCRDLREARCMLQYWKKRCMLPQVVNLNMVRGGWKGGSLCGFQPDWMITYPNIGVAASIPAKSQENQKDPPPNKVGPMFLSSDIQNKNVATTIWTCPCSSRFFGVTSKLLALWQRFGMAQALGLKTPHSWRKRSVLGKVFSLTWRTVPTSKPFLALLEPSWFKATRANGCGLARVVCLNYKTLLGPMLNPLTCIFNIWNVL